MIEMASFNGHDGGGKNAGGGHDNRFLLFRAVA